MTVIVKRVLLFLVPFSLLFWYIHEQFEAAISRSTASGLAGFYSADGLIFGLIVAFVIQREWETWINLSESVRTELDAIREMWMWSGHVGGELGERAHRHLEEYLRSIVSEWHSGGETARSEKVDAELDGLRGMVPLLPVGHSLSLPFSDAFVSLAQARNQRLNYSNEHMPVILKRIVVMADALFIVLSLFIAVNNMYLDYLFTASIGLLAFMLILVVDDLDNPFRPGAWHLTAEGYLTLLRELTAETAA